MTAGRVRLDLDPADGGKITSLCHDGVEWLEPSLPRDPDGAYAGGGGWDECIPTIGACRSPVGAELRDHGEAWRRPWSVLRRSRSVLDAEADLGDLTFRRHVSVRADRVILRYRVRARGDVDGVLWAAHPLFAATPGTRLLHSSATVDQVFPVRVRASSSFPAGIDAIAEGAAVKVFSAGLRQAALIRPDGHRLIMRWRGSAVAGAGLYWDRGLFLPGRSIVAIEPTTGLDDVASEIWESLPRARSGRVLRWSVMVQFERRNDSSG